MDQDYETERSYKGLTTGDFIRISAIAENAPYLATKEYELMLAGNSKGNSSSSCHSSNSSSNSASSAVPQGLEAKL